MFRWIPAGVYPACRNMALDEALFEAASRNPSAPPTLRFYSWSRPAVTAGYFQDVRELARRLDCQKRSLEVVRRLTGGGMVLHGTDLTFSLVMRLPDPRLRGDVKDSYLKINHALMRGLEDFFEGLDFADCRTVPSGRGGGGDGRVCFEKPSCYDLLWRGKKVVGASQRRKDGVLLHQSTIFLEKDKTELEKKIKDGFQKIWSVEFERAELTQGELKRADAIEKERYASAEWAFRPS